MPFDPNALRTAAESAPGFDEPPPPDIYEAELIKAETFLSKAGEDWLRLTWKVLTGRLRDHCWSHIQALERYKADGSDNEMALAITARILSSIGVDIAAIQTPNDLLPLLDRVRGSAFEVEVKRNGSFVNTTPKRRLESVQQDMPTGGYGQQAQPSSAIFQGVETGEVRRDIEKDHSVSDVPGDPNGEFVHPREKLEKGSIDPETGEPIPF